MWGRRGRGALLRGVAVGGGGGGCPGGMSGGRCGRAGRGLLRSFVSGCLLEERAGARGGWGVPSEDAFLRDVPGGEGRGGKTGCPGGMWGGTCEGGWWVEHACFAKWEEWVALARARGRWERGCGRMASPRVWSSRGLWQDAATRGCAAPRE